MLCSLKASQAQGPAPAADDSLAYINSTLQKYPTIEFAESGCAGSEQVLTISENRRSLNIKQIFFKPVDGGCTDVQTLSVPIFSLNLVRIGSWSKQGQHSTFILECTDRVDCFSRRPDTHVPASVDNQWFLQVTAPDEISDRLRKALKDLVASLLTEANARIDPNDPFAKRAH